MIITSKNIVHYLIDKNLISTSSIISGDILVVEMSRRNRNFKVCSKHQNGLFVKQVKHYDEQSIMSLQREAKSYQLVKTEPVFAKLADLMPNIIEFDSHRNILILELFPETENLVEMYHRIGHFPIPIARSLGQSLGSYHMDITINLEGARQSKSFPEKLPWMLTLTKDFIQQARKSDPRYNQFFSIIDAHPQFLASIAALRNEWQINSLMHGDIKWDNCLVPINSELNGQSIKIVDRELSDLGDAAWDIGAVFQSFISMWILCMPETFNNSSLKEEEPFQPAIIHFWDTYSTTTSLHLAAQQSLLEKCIKYAAIRMIQTVYEQLYFTQQLTKNLNTLLQVSLNILKRPREAISALLQL